MAAPIRFQKNSRLPEIGRGSPMNIGKKTRPNIDVERGKQPKKIRLDGGGRVKTRLIYFIWIHTVRTHFIWGIIVTESLCSSYLSLTFDLGNAVELAGSEEI